MPRSNIHEIYSDQQLRDIKIIIGQRVKASRKRKGIRQLELANLVNKNTFGRLENGTIIPSLETILKLSKLLDFSIANLFQDIETYLNTGVKPNEQIKWYLDEHGDADGS